jgi:biopolymer transport protein ExbD
VQDIRVRLCAAACVVVLAVPGCYVPTPNAHATLKVSSEGLYTFNGKLVRPEDLASTIANAKPQGDDLVVQLEVSATADSQTVRTAVAAITSARARVAFAGRNERP